MNLRLARDTILPMKRAYEMMVLVKSDFDGESAKKREELLKKLLGDGVTLKEIKLLGKKQLSYPIKKQNEAVYLLATAHGTIVAADVEKRATLDEHVLRVLVLGRGNNGKSKSQ